MVLFDAVIGDPEVLDGGIAVPVRFSELEEMVELTVLLMVEMITTVEVENTVEEVLLDREDDGLLDETVFGPYGGNVNGGTVLL